MYVNHKLRVVLVVISFAAVLIAACFSYKQTDYEKVIMKEMSFFLPGNEEMGFHSFLNNEDEKYYVFLPAVPDRDTLCLTIQYPESKGSLSINGKPYKSGDIWNTINSETNYSFTLTNLFGQIIMDKQLQVLVSQNLPSILVTVDSKEYLNEEKSKESGSLILLDEKGNRCESQALESFKVRGNLTATLDKKPYSFNLAKAASMLGMESGIKWNLLANATDGSYLRNKLILDLANTTTDAYEPDGEWIELYINGDYEGLYLLTQAVEIGESRLEIDPENNWFMEMELDFRLEESTPHVVTNQGQIFVIKSQGWVSTEDKAEVLRRLDDIESALFAKDGISTISGKTLSQLIDLDSFAHAFLIEEISGDHDTGIASQFAYMSKEDGLLYAGPVWDFDGTLGNVNTDMFKNPRALTASVEESRPQGNANQNRWLAAMYRNKEFHEILQRKYTEVFAKPLKNLIETKIDDYTAKINIGAKRDTFRWHEKCFGWMFVLPNNLQVEDEKGYNGYDVLDVQADMVRNFLQQKYEFLNELWVENRDFCIVTVNYNLEGQNPDYNHTMYYWVERGTLLQNVKGLPEPVKITKDCELEVRTE